MQKTSTSENDGRAPSHQNIQRQAGNPAKFMRSTARDTAMA